MYLEGLLNMSISNHKAERTLGEIKKKKTCKLNTNL